MEKINYGIENNISYNCLTPCKFHPVKVGSAACKSCEYNVYTDEHLQVVLCDFLEKTKNPEVNKGTLIDKSLIDRLDLAREELSNLRDRLKDIQDEVEILLEDKDDDIDNLQNVIDSLSRYV